MTPERLGSFEIIAPLGEGGSAIVYAAKDGEREIALKVLRPDVELEPREVDRFLEEAESMRRVSHPALVPVLRAGLLPGGRPYIAMPRLRGKTLAERLTAGPIPVSRAIALFEDIAGALAVLHGAGLVHRDIKPENVFWLEEQDRLVLLDLGIARDTSGLPSTTTRAGLMRGTPAYMAPERFFGKSANIRSDIYELALLLYAMVTATLPWDEGDAKGRIQPKPPSERGTYVPLTLSRVLMEALNLDIDHRPESVEVLVRQVRQSIEIGYEPTVLHPLTPPQPVRPDGLDRQGDAPPLAIPPPVLLPLAETKRAPYAPAGLLVSGQSAPPPVAPTPHAVVMPSGRPSGSGWLLAVGALIALVAAGAGALLMTIGRERPADSLDGARARVSDTPSEEAAVGMDPSAASASAAVDLEDTATPAPSAEPAAPRAMDTSPARSTTPLSSTTPPSSSANRALATSASTVASSVGAMPASCSQLISLMCSPTSGARPEECAAWKENVRKWRAQMSEPQVAEVCASAFSASKSGLEHRKSFKP